MSGELFFRWKRHAPNASFPCVPLNLVTGFAIKIGTTIGTVCCALALSGCSVLQPEPEPDAPLAQLAASASGEQREELKDEIARVCGHRADASVPESCSDSAIDAAVSNSAAAKDVPQQIRDLFLTIPTDSRALVATQYSEIAQPQDGRAVTLVDDTPTAVEGLQREFAVIYGLDVARGFADADTTKRIDAAKDLRLRRIAVLEESLASQQNDEEAETDQTVALPAYEFTDPATTPVDAQTAAAAVEELLEWSSAFWISAATYAQDDDFALLALQYTPKA